MKCMHCGKKFSENNLVYVPYFKQHSCYACFTRMIDKRVKANLTKHGLVFTGDTVLLSRAKDPVTRTINHVLVNLFKNHPKINTTFKKSVTHNKVIDYVNALRATIKFHEYFITKDYKKMKKELGYKYKKIIRPALNLTPSDAVNYCKANNLSFTELKLSSLEKAYLRILGHRYDNLFSVIKTIQYLVNKVIT